MLKYIHIFSVLSGKVISRKKCHYHAPVARTQVTLSEHGQIKWWEKSFECILSLFRSSYSLRSHAPQLQPTVESLIALYLNAVIVSWALSYHINVSFINTSKQKVYFWSNKVYPSFAIDSSGQFISATIWYNAFWHLLFATVAACHFASSGKLQNFQFWHGDSSWRWRRWC